MGELVGTFQFLVSKGPPPSYEVNFWPLQLISETKNPHRNEDFLLCRVTDSDCGPFNFQSNALPTELTRQ